MIEIPSLTKQKSVAEFAKLYVNLLQKAFGSDRVKTWAEGIGFKSRINFKHFLAGRRLLSPTQAEKLKESLDLGARDRANFEKLPAESSAGVEPSFFVSDDFFRTPLPTIVLNLCGIQTKMTLQDIEAVLRGAFSDEDIKESVNKLLHLDLIHLEGEKFLVRKFEGAITSVPGQKSSSSQEYFRVCHELSIRAWHLPLEEREMNAFTFRINSEDLPKLKDLVRDFRKNVCELGAPAHRNSVFQCSMSFFPVYLEKKAERFASKTF